MSLFLKKKGVSKFIQIGNEKNFSSSYNVSFDTSSLLMFNLQQCMRMSNERIFHRHNSYSCIFLYIRIRFLLP